MIKKSYQRRHLRAPLKESILYADGPYVLKASSLNISEAGLLLNEMPSFPENDDIPLMIPLPILPSLKNFSLLKMQTFSRELFGRNVIRVMGKMVRKGELSQNLDNIFRAKIGVEFIRITPGDQKHIAEFVETFTSNLIYLQALIDSFNTNEETQVKVRTLAKILGYQETEKIAQLRTLVVHDYKSLQWL
jgi:hypothetical protein